MIWEVIMRPAEKGIVVGLTNGQIFTVVGRVRYTRAFSIRPFTSFKGSLINVILRAEREAERLNT